MASEKEKEALSEPRDEKEPLKNGDLGDTSVLSSGDNEFDSSRARFIKDKDDLAAAEAHVDIEGNTSLDPTFVGLSKEELMKYADDPYWKKVRLALLIIFWVAWVAILAAAIVIIVIAPKCPPRRDLDWWQTSAVYRVYPRSFKDAKGEDGVGDIAGIHEKLGYLRNELNVTALSLGPIYPTENADFGYDITNFSDISPEFGTMEEFDNLRIAMHKMGMKLIMEFVPNHSSDKHPWFIESEKGTEEFKDFYVWHAGSGAAGEPNNWKSRYGGSAWTWSKTRQAWYYHQLGEHQPDLNLRSKEVKEHLKDVLSFWLKKGVDGFRVDSAAYLFENLNGTMDEPANGKSELNDYNNYDHIHTTYQPESYEIMTSWREVLDAVSEDTQKSRFLMVTSYGTPEQNAGFFQYNEKNGAQLATNMNLLGVKQGCRASCIFDLINGTDTESEMWPNWQLGNEDNSRMATRVGEEWVNAFNMLVMTIPGTPFPYYGEEIGMHDVALTFNQTKDPAGLKWNAENYMNYSRDPERTPMQWSYEENGGFSAPGVTPWLPLAADFMNRNVKTQQAHGSGLTNLEAFATYVTLREEPSLQWGSMEVGVTRDVLFYVRQAQGFPGVLVAVNLGPGEITVNFVEEAPRKGLVPPKAKVVASTANFDQDRASDFEVGTEVGLDNVYLKPTEGLVVRWEADDIPEKEL